MNPRVSVVIPVYNRADSIVAAVTSALHQTLPPHEVIVVDDGSADRSAEMVESIADPRVRCIRQANGGAGSARNRALDVASGDWIAFLDSDDVWDDGRLASAAAMLEADDELDFIQCNRVHRYADGRVDTGLRAGPEVVTDVLALLGGFTIKTSAVMIRRSLLERFQLRFPTDQKTCEDYHLFWRALLFARHVGYDPQPHVTIHAVSSSLSRANTTAYLQKDNIKTLIEVRAWAAEQGAAAAHLEALDQHLHWQQRDYLLMLMRARDFRSLAKAWRVALGASGATKTLRATVSAMLDVRRGEPSDSLPAPRAGR